MKKLTYGSNLINIIPKKIFSNIGQARANILEFEKDNDCKIHTDVFILLRKSKKKIVSFIKKFKVFLKQVKMKTLQIFTC